MNDKEEIDPAIFWILGIVICIYTIVYIAFV